MSDFVDFYNFNSDSLKHLILRMKQSLWEKQDKVCVHKEGHRYPVLADDAYDVIAKVFDEEIGYLRWEICMAFLDYYYRDVIDPGENRKDLEEYFGWKYPDWEDDLPKEVYFKHNHERMTRPAFLPF